VVDWRNRQTDPGIAQFHSRNFRAALSNRSFIGIDPLSESIQGDLHMTRSKHTSELIGCLLIALLMTTGVSYGQSQMPPATSQAGTAAPGQPSKGMGPCPCMGGEMMHGPMFMHRGPGMPGAMGMQGPMGMPGMEMGGMGPAMGMMPMMMPPHMMMRMVARNPKLAGKMMQMHADMMRAIADVLTKYGKEMEAGQWPAPQKGGEGEGE
jgi:hypothetical protein